MSENYGKRFESVIRKAFEKVPNVSIDRLHDQTNGFRGSQNICDFIVYREPYEYYFECKSVRRASLPFVNITDTQWNGLLEKSQIEGVFAGVICWWIDKDRTAFISIYVLQYMRENGAKSFPCSLLDTRITDWEGVVEIKGKKKRVFFDYDMEEFLNGLGRVSK